MKIKKIEGFKGYSIREDGAVISHPKKMGRGKGYIKPESIMVPKLDKNGYHVVGLRKEGKKHFFSVHRLIANAFIFNPYNKHTVDHANRDRLDNRIENLRWATIQENNRNVCCKSKCGFQFISKKIDKCMAQGFTYQFQLKRPELKHNYSNKDLEVVKEYRNKFCLENQIEFNDF